MYDREEHYAAQARWCGPLTVAVGASLVCGVLLTWERTLVVISMASGRLRIVTGDL